MKADVRGSSFVNQLAKRASVFLSLCDCFFFPRLIRENIVPTKAISESCYLMKVFCSRWCSRESSIRLVPSRLGIFENSWLEHLSFWQNNKKQQCVGVSCQVICMGRIQILGCVDELTKAQIYKFLFCPCVLQKSKSTCFQWQFCIAWNNLEVSSLWLFCKFPPRVPKRKVFSPRKWTCGVVWCMIQDRSMAMSEPSLEKEEIHSPGECL